MSLVYDALRQPATDAAVVAAGSLPPQAAAPWTRTLAGYRRPALWLLCGMLVAGPVGSLVSRPAADAAADVTVAQEAVRAPIPATPATVAMVDAAMPATTGNPSQAAVIDADAVPMPPVSNPAATTTSVAIPAQPTAAPAVAVAPTPVPTPAAPTPAAVAQAGPEPARTDVQVVASQIQLSVRKADAAGTRAAASEEADANAVRGAMAELNAAVGEHDAEATAAAIARLQALLPAGSLTLLRARAWAAHGQGDYARAEQLYRAILDRVPDDEHAGVNLALLDARRGEMAEARARLDRMAARNARSPQIVQALAELDAARR
ncbi:tetratricopeptide repeat protein [Pseudoxanthomonas sp.]|uniref:tetratricopeptide repeat protein n=1 Tax=Pseudoxanthomonas sp. TaxID=1871049 RepID=UPI002583D27B|nr:tetratricopeptide repeat protein [Pseudoxanthomonas sp.]MCR6685642.1 tetratricopeptide repeat protein [Pseudoxanthomonas sp.]